MTKQALLIGMPIAALVQIVVQIVASGRPDSGVVMFLFFALAVSIKIRPGLAAVWPVLYLIVIINIGLSMARLLGAEIGGAAPGDVLIIAVMAVVLTAALEPDPPVLARRLLLAIVFIWATFGSILENLGGEEILARLVILTFGITLIPWIVRKVKEASAAANLQAQTRAELLAAVATATNQISLGGDAGLRNGVETVRHALAQPAVALERIDETLDLVMVELLSGERAPGDDRAVDILDHPATREAYDDPSLLHVYDTESGVVHVPVRERGRLLGFVRVMCAPDSSPGGPEIDALAAFAEAVGASWSLGVAEYQIESASGELRRQMNHQDALARCAQALLVSGGDLALWTTAEAIREAIHGDVGILIHVDDSGGDGCRILTAPQLPGIQAPSTSDPDHLDPRIRARLQEAFAEDGPFEATESDLELFAEQLPSSVELAELVLVPIFQGGAKVGAVGVGSSAERFWQDDELAVIDRAAVLVGAYWSEQQVQAELRRTIASKDEFVASISHELRTPLSVVLGMAHELHDNRGNLGNEETEEFTRLIAEQAAEVSHIVEDLLVAARAENDMLVILPEIIDLAESVRLVVDQILVPEGIELRLDIGPTAGWADPYRVRQIVRNLVTNAFRYGGTSVAVRTGVDANGHAMIEVVDDGEGIPDDKVDAVFTAYQRAHSTVGRPESVGLGLAVARRLARMMSGDVCYERRGATTVFRASFPIAAARSHDHTAA